MTIDIIICTRNRPLKLKGLVNELFKCHPLPSSIIIVDSSDISISDTTILNSTTYIKSNRKNQPYQRYIGYLNSTADVLVYLDDDMEIIDYSFINDIVKLFNSKPDLSGIALNFVDKQSETSLSQIPKSVLKTKNSKISKWINCITGYPLLNEGEWGMNGIRGPQPLLTGGGTQWLSGGAFAAKKKCMYKNFNFQLFDLFEKGLGMGEDGVLGYTLSKQGILYYYPKLLFYHNDLKDSTYSIDLFKFAKRVIYSRLYLSLEKVRLDNNSKIIAYTSFVWFAIWRIFGLTINLFINYSSSRKKILKGTIMGFIMSFKFEHRLINKINI